MTAVSQSPAVSRHGFNKIVADSRVITWRNLKRIPRIPELAIFAIFQSIMFVLLFAFVFGGAILLPGYTDPNAYREYLLPGVFCQTIAFAAATTAVGMCDDMNKGIIDRFRSLPMARSAVIAGRTAGRRRLQRRDPDRADAVGSGRRLVGQQRHPVVPRRCRAAAAVRLRDVVDRRLARAVGPTVEVAQQVSFIVIFPLSFVSSAFVPIATMPTWLQPFAEWNPISVITSACRELFGNPNPFARTGAFPRSTRSCCRSSGSWSSSGSSRRSAVRRYRSMSR